MALHPSQHIAGVVQRYARLVARYGSELGERPLVLPNAEFFPDEFRSNERGLKLLVKRMQRHAGMMDIPIETRMLEDARSTWGCCGAPEASSCSPGGGAEPVARVIDQGDGWVLQVPEAETRQPVVLTTNLARCLGYVFLIECSVEAESIDASYEATADLAAVALGFGVLLLEGSYLYQRSCHGPVIGRVTKLGTGELAVATALFLARAGCSPRPALKELGPTQRSALREALGWIRSNPELEELLRHRPEQLARGGFELIEPRPWLLRWLGRKLRWGGDPGRSSLDRFDASLEQIESMLSALPPPLRREPKPVDPKQEEIKALVKEALGS